MSSLGPTPSAEQQTTATGHWSTHPWFVRLQRASILLVPLTLGVALWWVLAQTFPPERLGINKWAWIGSIFVASIALFAALHWAAGRIGAAVAGASLLGGTPAAAAGTTVAWAGVVATLGLAVSAASGVLPLGEDNVEEESALPGPLASGIAVDDVVADPFEGTVEGGSIEIPLRAEGGFGPLSFVVGGPAHGEAWVVDTAVPTEDESGWQTTARYVPTPGYRGEDGFSYEACDAELRCSVAQVNLLVSGADEVEGAPGDSSTSLLATTTSTSDATTSSTAGTNTSTTSANAPTTTTTTTPSTTSTTSPTTTGSTPNAAPTANNDSAVVNEDASVLIDVLGNDTDPDGDALTITGVGSPLRGTVAVVGGSVRYTPTRNFSGSDQFSYTMSDGTHADVVATVSVTVSPVNDAPVASVAASTIDESASTNSAVVSVVASDAEGSTLGFTITGGDPLNQFAIDSSGAISLVGSLDYETTPSYALQVTVHDGTTPTVVTAGIDVNDVDEAPTALDDAIETTTGSSVVVPVGANDSDPEGASLIFVVPSISAAGGTLIETNGSVQYTPPAGYQGIDSFTYLVVDLGGNASAAATVSITIQASVLN